jgi:hypothetical protein
MSEEILKALTQLFAIITKQDGGVSENERQFVIDFFQQELEKSAIAGYLELYDSMSGYTEQQTPHIDDKSNKLTSVKDSIKTLAICKKINKTLAQKQKVIVLNKLLELVGSDKHFTPQRMEIVNTVSTVFNIVQDEYKLIESFVISDDPAKLNFKDILVADEGTQKIAPPSKAHSYTCARSPDFSSRKQCGHVLCEVSRGGCQRFEWVYHESRSHLSFFAGKYY